MKRYYPLINIDGEGTEKFPVFFSYSEKTARSNHMYFLEEYERDCYILHYRSGAIVDFTVRCPKCGKTLHHQYSNYYTCLSCKE